MQNWRGQTAGIAPAGAALPAQVAEDQNEDSQLSLQPQDAVDRRPYESRQARTMPETVRAYLPPRGSYTNLGTDGFGRSDTRAALCKFFGVDAASVVRAALASVIASQV